MSSSRATCTFIPLLSLVCIFFPFFSFCSFYWNSLHQLSDATLLFAFTLKWRTRRACVSLLLRQSINDLGRKRHRRSDYARRRFWSLCCFQRTSAHERRELMVVYYFHKAIIISRDAICLFFVIYCHQCGMNRCRACFHVSSRAHMRLKWADIDTRPTLFARTLTDCKRARNTQGQFADISKQGSATRF